MKTFAIAAAVALAAPLFGAPVTREQLVAMAREKVDPSVMRALVDRDCVDFDVDAANAAELSKVLPAGVLQAAIACRKAGAPARSSETTPPAPPPAVSTHPPAASAAPPPPRSEASAILPAATAGEIRVRAVFIGESAALSCSCALDGRDVATLTKEAQGNFGEAVERAKIGRQTPYLPAGPGHHVVVCRCDPGGQAVSAAFDLAAGDRRTVEFSETAFRHWKLRKIDKK